MHSILDFEEFLDLMLEATNHEHAYALSRDRFGDLPLRFDDIIITGFRKHLIGRTRRRPAHFPIIAAEYICPKSRDWLYIFPGGPIVKDAVTPLVDGGWCDRRHGWFKTKPVAVAFGGGLTSGTLLRGGILPDLR